MAPVVVVSENFAREFWKEPAAAIGRRIRQTPSNPWRTIVGVVGNERDNGVVQPAPAIIYWPLMIDNYYWKDKPFAQRNLGYAIRTDRAGSPTLLKEIQQAVWAVNANLPVASVRTLDQIRPASMAQTSFALVMLAIAAAVALLLGVVGIYGVIAYVATAAHEGDRHPHRARRRAARRQPPVRASWARAGRHRHRAAASSAAALLTRAMSTLLFGVSALRSADLCGRRGRRSGATARARELPAGAARGARRSGGSVEVGSVGPRLAVGSSRFAGSIAESG